MAAQTDQHRMEPIRSQLGDSGRAVVEEVFVAEYMICPKAYTPAPPGDRVMMSLSRFAANSDIRQECAMPFPKGTMVEVTNDKIPWYGEVKEYIGGVYTVKVGGSDMTVSVNKDFIKLHPAMEEAQKLRKLRLEQKFKLLKKGSGELKLIAGFADILGMAANNALADTIAGNPGGGAILTVANANALLTLMWPSMSHVIVVDIEPTRINNLMELLKLAEESETLMDWYCKIFERYGSPVLDKWINRYRPYYQNFLALKHARSRLHTVTLDLSADGAPQTITSACSCHCTDIITMMYISNIEFYVKGGLGIGKGSPEALARYQKNILALMLESTILIRSDSVMMEINNGKSAAKLAWGIQ